MNWDKMAKLLERYPLPQPRIATTFRPKSSEPAT